TFSTIAPFGNVRPGVLEMTFECPIDQSLETIKQRLDENIRGIKQYLGWQEGPINEFNRNLPSLARSAIEARRKRLEQHDKLAGLLNIPLRHNPNAPEFRPINVQRRIVKSLPPAPTGGFKQEWTI